MNQQAEQLLSLRKKLIFSAVIFLSIWCVSELFLLGLGLGALEKIEDPFVGFDSNSPLFVESEDLAPGELVTAEGKQVWFNYQRFTNPKQPNTKRIFCLGGSTTYGRPFDDETAFSGWLRELLPVIDSETDWEVINAGGVSYASYRVANVMEELCQYQPDLFVVLTGHNEFLERRTYAGLLEGGLSDEYMIAQTRSFLQSSRVFNLIESFIRPKSQFMIKDREKLPEEVDEILNHSAGPRSYERDDIWQDKVLFHFQFNLQRMVVMAKQAGAEIVFVSPASNLRDCLPFKTVSEIKRNSADPHGVSTQIAGQQEQLVDLSRAQLQLSFDDLDKASLLKRIERQLMEDPRNADLLFFKGRCLFGLGDWDSARKAFCDAVDEDVCPLRATRSITSVIQKVASENSVPCINFEEKLGAVSFEKFGHRCFGSEYFLDHVHPTIETHGLIANEVVEELKKIGWLDETNNDSFDFDDVSLKIHSKVDLERQAIAFRNLAKVLHWAGKFEEAIPNAVNATQLIKDDLESLFVMADCLRQLGRDDEAYLIYEQLFKKGDYSRACLPFSELLMDRGEYDRAIEFLILATLSPNESHRVRAFYDLGLSHLQLGEFEFALESLKECEKLAGEDAATVALIGEAHLFLRQYDEAERRFKQALAFGGDPFYQHQKLAEVYLKQERSAEAIGHLRRCLELQPSDQHIQELLEEIDASNRSGNTQ